MSHKNYMYVGPYIKPSIREKEIVKKSLVCVSPSCQKQNSFLRGAPVCLDCGSEVVETIVCRTKVKEKMTVEDMFYKVFNEEESKEIYHHWNVESVCHMLHSINDTNKTDNNDMLVETLGHRFDKDVISSNYWEVNPVEFFNIDLNYEKQTWEKAQNLAAPLIKIAKKYGFNINLEFGVVHLHF